MNQQRMKELIEQHIAAEIAGDSAGAVSVYTDDVEHDVIGSPTGPVHGPAAAQGFYDQLTADLNTERMTPTREQYGDDFCVVEHEATCVVNGAFIGIPGDGRRVTFRMLHVWDFKDDAISREQVWLDGSSIAAQLTAPESHAATTPVAV
jgi:ketosteroid isomerase-like protein